MNRLQKIAFTILILILVWTGGCNTTPKTEQISEQTTAIGHATPETETQSTAVMMLTASVPTFTEQPTAHPTMTQLETPLPIPTPTLLSVADIVALLESLSLDNFFEESYKQLLLRDPEMLTELGISESYGLRDDRLNNIFDAYIGETCKLQEAILDLLRTYDRGGLTPEQQISYDVYEWYLDDLVRGQEFMYYDYPVHHFIGSYHDELIRLFTVYHPLADVQDAEDYVSRLLQVDDQVEKLIEGLKLRQEVGVIPPSFIIQLARSEIHGYLQTYSTDPASIDAKSLSVYTVFRAGLYELGLTAEEKQALLDDAALAIQVSFIPAYMKLLDHLESQAAIATEEAGVWKFPNGDAYYAYLLRSQTTTDLTPAEIHELGLAEVARIQEEMRAIFAQLSYPEDESLGEMVNRAVADGGHYSGIDSQAGQEQLIDAYKMILDEMNHRLDEVFDIRPSAELEIVGETEGMGGYYVSASSDGSRPGAFHVGLGSSRIPKFNMPTLAYHEAIPGHHFQIAIAQELDLPMFRNDLFFTGYGEGWAMYAERLAWELGLYDDDPYGNVGRLMLELLRAARLVADTGIHAMHWTREEANEYMAIAFGSPPGTFSYEVDRFIVRPAQATGYKIGMLKILELRQKAMDQLGERFDIKEFHNVVLGNSSMPLAILELVVQRYIDAKLE